MFAILQPAGTMKQQAGNLGLLFFWKFWNYLGSDKTNPIVNHEHSLTLLEKTHPKTEGKSCL